MRTDLSAGLLTAISKESINISVRGTIYKSRASFLVADLDDTYEASFAHSVGILAEPVAQDYKYSTAEAKPLTVYAESDVLKYQTPTTSPISLQYAAADVDTDDRARPAIVSDGVNDFIFYYYDDKLYRLTLSGTTVSTKEELQESSTSIWSSTEGICAIHALTKEKIVVLYVGPSGGIAGCYVYKSGVDWLTIDLPGEWINPETILDTTEDETYFKLHFSGAVLDGNGDIFIYVSQTHNGSVSGIRYSSQGIWSERFTSVPSDLSQFIISNAMVAPNGNIILCGQFQRVDDTDSFSSTYVYSLALWSLDGFTFSLDSDCLFALGDSTGSDAEDAMALRFMVAAKEGTIYFSDCGRFVTDDSPYYSDDENSESLSIVEAKIVKLSGSVDKMVLLLGNSDEVYSSNALVKRGNRCKIEVGYQMASSREWAQLMDGVITEIVTNEADGVRDMELHLTSASMYRAARMTHPFYMEMQSKQSHYDDLVDFSHLYDAASEIEYESWLIADFYNEGTLQPVELYREEEYEFQTIDLDTLGHTNLPVISELPLNIELYGWSRYGGTRYTKINNYDDNDDLPYVTCILYIEDDDENIRAVELNTYSSTYKYFIHEYLTTGQVGSYPVIVTGSTSDGLAVGDRIKRIGMRFEGNQQSYNEYQTVMAERVEIPEVVASVDVPGETWDDYERTIGPKTQNTFAVDREGWEFEDLSTGLGKMDGTREAGELCLSAVRPIITNQGWWQLDGCGTVAVTDATFQIVWEVAETADHVYSFGVVFTDATSQGTTLSGSSGTDTITILVGNNGKTIDYFYIKSVYDGKKDRVFTVSTVNLSGFTLPVSQSYWGKRLLTPGAQKVLLSTTPYTTMKCEVSAAFRIAGEDIWGGVVCLAKDGDNYIAARMNHEKVDLIKVRSGRTTVVATTAYTPPSDSEFWRILLRHTDGVFNIFVSDEFTDFNVPDWGAAELTHTWGSDDGAICTDEDVNHVGTYMFMDFTSALIAGWNPSTAPNVIGLVEGGKNDLGDFSSSGDLLIGNQVVAYQEKLDGATTGRATPAVGPYPGWRSFMAEASLVNWITGGTYYKGYGVGIYNYQDFPTGLLAKYYDAPDIRRWFKHYILAVDNGENWIITRTDFSPSVFYEDESESVSTDFDTKSISLNFVIQANQQQQVGPADRCYITVGFARLQFDDPDNMASVPNRSPIFQYDADVFGAVLEFSAHSENNDSTVEDMLDKILKLAGGEAKFPGGYELANKSLTTTPWEVA